HSCGRENVIAGRSAAADQVDSSPEKADKATLGASLRFCPYQPARKFFLQLARKIDTKLGARLQTQRITICSIKHELHGARAGRAGENLAHFTQFLARRFGGKSQENRGLVLRSVWQSFAFLAICIGC